MASTALAGQAPLSYGQKDLIHTCAEFEKASRKLPSPAASLKNPRNAELRGWVREKVNAKHQGFTALDHFQLSNICTYVHYTDVETEAQREPATDPALTKLRPKSKLAWCWGC